MILLTSDTAIFHEAVAASTFLSFDIVHIFFDAARGTLICRLLCAAHDILLQTHHRQVDYDMRESSKSQESKQGERR